MNSGLLEHVNITVQDPQAMADRLVRIFGWKIRWSGASMNKGFTVHVGTEDRYLALYSWAGVKPDGSSSYERAGGLNHVGVVVEDFEGVEERVVAEGLVAHQHAEYEPGRRFYFDDLEGVEFEVVSYG